MLSRLKVTMVLDISSTSVHSTVVTDINEWLPGAVEDYLMPNEGIVEFSVEPVDK